MTSPPRPRRRISASTSTTRTASTRRRPPSTGPAGPLPSSIAPLSTATARTLTERVKTMEKTIIDRTCRTSTKFDCPTEYGYGKDSYGKGEDYGKDYKKPECHKSSSTSCYDTPRTVIVPKCST